MSRRHCPACKNFLLIFLSMLLNSIILANNQQRTVNLVITYKTVHFAGKARRALAINQQIPGPTLHFRQGDHVTINVYNHLDKGTAIHWHGILVPWQMDGVEGISQAPIPPGGVFHYRFTLYQSGTYWYHAHLSAQEQEGLYGAFIIDPRKPLPYHYTKDFVMVLSDWSNTAAEKIFTNLKKTGDYYSSRFPLQPSLVKFIHDYRQASLSARKKLIEDYKMMQQMRMSIYDLSDVAYDAYLLNGHTKADPWTAKVKAGDIVRLRFIDAGGSTIYHVKIAGQTAELVHVQGNNVRPEKIKSFIIAPGETDDILVKINKNKPYIIYAESLDTLGKVYGALITVPQQQVDYHTVKPFPGPVPVTQEMMMNMMPSDHSNHHQHQQHSMSMPTEPTILGDRITDPDQQGLQIKTHGTQYQQLIAAVKTNNPKRPVDGIIRMELFGYMNHFIWFINGRTGYQVKPLVLTPNKRYRIIFTNNSMMRHPMHIHGHWFILRNGHGAYDPLLHTIEVPPGATAVADVDTDASGQWFFHCHHLYHMLAGMSRIVQYDTVFALTQKTASPQNYVASSGYVNRPIVREDIVMPIDPTLIHHPMAHPSGFYFANFLELSEDPFHNIQEASFTGLYGNDYNKLQLHSNDAELNKGTVENADIDIFYWHLLNQFWAIKGGANYVYRPGGPYWQPGIGIEGLMPYFIETDVRTYYHASSVKFDLELARDTQITRNFFLRLAVRSILATQTVIPDEIGSGLNQMRYTVQPYYRLSPNFNIFTKFEHNQDYGAFKNIRHNLGEPTQEDVVGFGIDMLF